MPRFFFDVRDGELFIEDDEGRELSGLEEAREHAAIALADMAKNGLPQRFEAPTW